VSGEPEELAALVHRVLGPLARDDEKMWVLRETLDAFLAEGGSYARAAARLLVHRNTVQYRIRQIADRYRISPSGDAFELRFALGVCRWHRTALASAPDLGLSHGGPGAAAERDQTAVRRAQYSPDVSRADGRPC
jgi:hypothetical protein